MTATLQVAGRLTAADTGARTLSGVLLPYATPGRTSAGRVTASAGSLTLPDDPGEVSLNIEHDYTRPVGRASGLTDTDAGLQARFLVANTRAGDDLLEEVREGLRTHLSVEVDDPVIRAGRLVGGRLTAAAVVVRPAFDGADLTMTAADTPGVDPAPDTPDAPDVTPDDTPDEVHEVTVDGVPYVPETTTAADEPADEDDDREDPTVTDTLTAAAPRGVHSPATATPVLDVRHPRDVFRLLASAVRDGNRQLFAALSDITISGAGSVGETVAQPRWIGEFWAGEPHQRVVVPRLNSGDLTSLVVQGWRWSVKPRVDRWAGNKSDVPSNTPTVVPDDVTAQRFAGAHDIAREWRDFPNEAFWASYFEAMRASYSIESDAYALEELVAAATPVTLGTVPAGGSAVLAALVDAALVVNRKGTPSFAFLADDVFREYALLDDDHILSLLSAALPSLDEGSFGGFSIQPTPYDQDGAPVLTSGQILVGTRRAATFLELPGSPIRVEGLDIARGGIDPALFGYAAVQVDEPGGIALADTTPVNPAGAPAARTSTKK